MTITRQTSAPERNVSGLPKRMALRPELASVVFLGVLVVVFSVTATGFLSLSNVGNIIEQVAIIGILALGLNMVILSDEIDISVGSNLAITTSVTALVAVATGGNLVLTVLTAIALASAIGAFNGALVVKARIPSIIVTLAMLTILRGLNNMINPTGIPSVPEGVRIFGQGKLLGLSVSAWVFVVLAIVVAVVARHTVWGRDLPAVGGNTDAARFLGLPVDRVRFIAFAVGGLCVGIGSLVYLGQLGAVQPAAGTGLELQVIAAVVVGGTSISGGRGSVLAAVIGAILMGTILNGANLLGLQERWQSVFIGAVILLAIGAEFARRRVLERLVLK
ncbi:ABC transporter permease [Rhodococcus opacus]|uniref:ABC transporter permease n=1 Tax=Rhodococcus opacus TaxID=37919 RepID=UPI001C444CC3|nr:ABC transporter permease [Rhodococcus opacus]MBV6760250.1 ABC transporter permease [Rhodococcus opacus]